MSGNDGVVARLRAHADDLEEIARLEAYKAHLLARLAQARAAHRVNDGEVDDLEAWFAL